MDIRLRQITVKRKGFIDHLQRRLIQVNKVKPPWPQTTLTITSAVTHPCSTDLSARVLLIEVVNFLVFPPVSYISTKLLGLKPLIFIVRNFKVFLDFSAFVFFLFCHYVELQLSTHQMFVFYLGLLTIYLRHQ